ncbi:hypothetical protein AURDEDRAFT_89090, partial [Auricularia subglabra TFB-10046 SS5]
MANLPYHGGGPVAMSRPSAPAQHPYNASARHPQPAYSQPQVRFATQYKRSEDEEADEDSKSDQSETTDDEHEEESPTGPPATMGGFHSGIHHSLQRERLADPAFTTQPYRAPPGAGVVPLSSTSAPRAKPPPLSAQRSMPEAASRPIPVPVPPQRSSTTLSGSPSRSSGYYPTGANSSYGAAGSWGSGSDRDRGSLGDRGPKSRPTLPGHDDWRSGTDSPVTTEKPRIWKPRPDASPPSSPATLAPKTSLESLRTSSAVPLSSSPTTSTLRRESSNTGLRASAAAHGHVSSLSTVPELSRVPSTPSATSAARNPGQKIWHPPSAEYERQHEEAAAELKEKEREQMRIATSSSSTMAMAGARGSRPGSSASVYASSPASYSPVVPKHGSPYPSSRDSIFSTVSSATSYTSAGTYLAGAQHLSDSPPSSPQLFPHTIPDSPMPNRRSSTYEPVSSASRPSRSSSTSTPVRPRTPPPTTARRNAPVTISAELDSDAAEWVRVLRQEHVARFEAQKKLVEEEFQYKWLDIAKREAEAALKPSSSIEDFQSERARVKADFDNQMKTLQMLEDGNLQDAIATEEASRKDTSSASGAPPEIPPELWEENMRAEQEIALEQIKRERSASLDQGPGPSRPPDNKDKDKDSSIHARSEEERAAALHREKSKIEEEQRKRAASKDDWERNKASMREATIRREARKAAAVSDESGEETEDDEDGDVEMANAFPPIKSHAARRPSDPPSAPAAAFRKQPPARSATMPDASAATAAPVQTASRSQHPPSRQGSVPMDIPGARSRPPMARGDSYSTDSGRDASKPTESTDPMPPTQRERHAYSMTFSPGERAEPGPQRRSSNASVPSTPATPNMPHAAPVAHAKANSPYATVPPSSLGGDPKPAARQASSSSSVSSPRPQPQTPASEPKDAFAEAAARRQREQIETEARRQAEADAARRQREREREAQAQAQADAERAQQRRESEERERERQKRVEEERAQQKREAEEREKLRREVEERERLRREADERQKRAEQERLRRDAEERAERARREEHERAERARREEQERVRREAERRAADERRAAEDRARKQREAAADRERERLKREAEQLQREEEFARREEEARRRYQDRKRQEDEEKERRRYA